MGLDTRGMSERERMKLITEALGSMRKKIGITDGLASRGVRASEISALAKHAVKDACVVTNPRYVGIADAEVIYGEAL